MQMNNLKVKLLSSNAIMPVKGDEGAAGYDLYASESKLIKPWSRELVKTDVSFEIPHSYYGRIASRSSLGVKGFDIGAGVIDSSYRGEVKVVFINATNTAFQIEMGNRIAQIIFENCHKFDLVQADEISVTDRGSGGFGSTGT